MISGPDTACRAPPLRRVKATPPGGEAARVALTYRSGRADRLQQQRPRILSTDRRSTGLTAATPTSDLVGSMFFRGFRLPSRYEHACRRRAGQKQVLLMLRPAGDTRPASPPASRPVPPRVEGRVFHPAGTVDARSFHSGAPGARELPSRKSAPSRRSMPSFRARSSPSPCGQGCPHCSRGQPE
jgi:hypothetical protein